MGTTWLDAQPKGERRPAEAAREASMKSRASSGLRGPRSPRRSPLRALWRALVASSRWLHRWVGLVAALFMAWMGLSGVLLNHPGLIAAFDVPAFLVPERYRIEGWERGVLAAAVFDPSQPATVYVAGRLGAARSDDGGRSFASMNEGLPEDLYRLRARDALLFEGALWLAIEDGLYAARPPGAAFRKVPLPGDEKALRRVLEVEGRLLVVSESRAFVGEVSGGDARFRELPLRLAAESPGLRATSALIALHDGSAWGVPGKLVYDFFGLVLVFLSISAIFIWYFPRRRSIREKLRLRPHRLPSRGRLTRSLRSWHDNLGVWIGVPLVVIALTGLFLRPPFVQFVADATLPRALYPAPFDGGSLAGTIRNAAFDATSGRLLLQSSGGVFAAGLPAEPSGPLMLEPVEFPAPISGMGANVFEIDDEGALLVGSFSGLYRVDAQGALAALPAAPEAAPGRARAGRGRVMASGLAHLPSGESYVACFRRGLVPLEGPGDAPAPRIEIERELGARMPLWTWLFELHNGRIFSDFIGRKLAGYVVAAGSFTLLLILLTGYLDWWVAKRRRARTPG